MSKHLSDVGSNKHFHLKSGKRIKGLIELADALKTMNDSTFAHHVNRKKNDFANWVRDVIKNEKLAYKMVRIENKEKLINIINKEISRLKNPSTIQNPISNIKEKLSSKTC